MEKYAGTQSLGRAFALLKLFDDERPFWTLNELIDATSLTKTTAFRLLSALEAEGILRKTNGGEYALGPELIVLGGRAMRANNLRTVAQPILEQLVRDSAESVTIDVLWTDDQNRPYSLVIEEKLGRHLMGMSQYIGGRFPAHTTSTGKVLLAYQPQSVLDQLNLAGWELTTAFTVENWDAFSAEIPTIHKQGVATTHNELEIGLSAIAAPIFNHDGLIQAAICIATPSSRMSDGVSAELTPLIKIAANQISHAIGFTQPKS